MRLLFFIVFLFGKRKKNTYLCYIIKTFIFNQKKIQLKMKKSIATKVAPMSAFNAETTEINMKITHELQGVKVVGKIELPAQKIKKIVSPIVAPVAPVKQKRVFNLDIALQEAKSAEMAQKALVSYWNIEKFQFHTPESEIISKMKQFWGCYKPNKKLTGVLSTLQAHSFGTPFANLV